MVSETDGEANGETNGHSVWDWDVFPPVTPVWRLATFLTG